MRKVPGMALLVVAGIALRAVSIYPLYKWDADFDDVLTGIRAIGILQGHFPVYLHDQRLGAFEAYLHAGPFALFGVSRLSQSIVLMLEGALLLAVFALLAHTLLGKRAAIVATALVALPSPAFLFWSFRPNVYATTLLLSCTALLFADRLARRGGTGTAALFGAIAGLGLWNSLQTIAFLVPAAAWVLLLRPGIVREWRLIAAGSAGFVAGAAPLLVYNAVTGFGTFSFTLLRPADGSSGLWSNVRFFFLTNLRFLFTGREPSAGVASLDAASRMLTPAVSSAWVALCAFGTYRVLSRGREALVSRSRALTPGGLLLLSAGLMAALLTVLSAVGAERGQPVRYTLLCYFAAAAAAGLAFEASRGAWRVLAAGALGAVLAFNAMGLRLPGSPYRESLRHSGQAEAKVLTFLEQNHVEVVWGHAFWTFPLNFLSHERIRAVPYQTAADHFYYGQRLPVRPRPWALYSVIPGEVEEWAERAKVSGTVLDFGYEHRLFLPSPNPPSSEPLSRTQTRLLASVPPPGGSR